LRGIFAIFRKELEDHFSSIRCILISAVILMVGVIVVSTVGMDIQEAVKGMQKPTLLFLLLFTTGKFSFAQFLGVFGPIIGIVLGFDAINRERVSRTLSKLVSQPIYRDSIINGKFLTGVTIISIILVAIVLLISGLGVVLIGVVPGAEEISRLVIYLVLSILYVSFWLGISILFSVIFRSTATSALASLALWIFFSIFLGMGASFLAGIIVPTAQTAADPAMAIKSVEIQRVISLFSPMTLYSQATFTILDPTRNTTNPLAFVLMGPFERISLSRFQSPLPLLQSLLIVTPYLVSIVAITLLSFGICYYVFMRQEIRTI
jgi:ABC-2 type transport system permease protein